MVGPLDAIGSMLQGAVLQGQLLSAQREGEISNERRLRAAERARRRAERAVAVVEPLEGRIIEPDTPLNEAFVPPHSTKHARSERQNPDPGRIDVLV